MTASNLRKHQSVQKTSTGADVLVLTETIFPVKNEIRMVRMFGHQFETVFAMQREVVWKNGLVL
jgi:hypothetical protein